MSKHKKIFHKPDENIPSADDILNYLNEDAIPLPSTSLPSKSNPGLGSVGGGSKDKKEESDFFESAKLSMDENEESVILPAPSLESSSSKKRKSKPLSNNRNSEKQNRKKHELEKAMLSEPFVSDAVEGFALLEDKEKSQSIIFDINQQIINQTGRKESSIAIMKIAAIAAVVVMISGGSLYLFNQFESNTLTDSNPENKQNVAGQLNDTSKNFANNNKKDSLSLAFETEKKIEKVGEEESQVLRDRLQPEKPIVADGYITQNENAQGPVLVEPSTQKANKEEEDLSKSDNYSSMDEKADEKEVSEVVITQSRTTTNQEGTFKRQETTSDRVRKNSPQAKKSKQYSPSFMDSNTSSDKDDAKGEAKVEVPTLEQGIDFYKSNKFNEARNIFSGIEQLMNSNQEFLFYSGMTEYKLKSYDSSLKYLSKVAGASSHFDEARWTMALIYIDLGKKDQAVILLKQLSETGNTYSEKATKKLKKIE